MLITDTHVARTVVAHWHEGGLRLSWHHATKLILDLGLPTAFGLVTIRGVLAPVALVGADEVAIDS